MAAGPLIHDASSDPQSAGDTDATPPAPAVGNADCPWDLFDSEAYLAHNYSAVLEPDRLIIKRLGAFFGSVPAGPQWHGVDVGSGTNLYPALAVLPLVTSITLWEYSQSNVEWLRRVLRSRTRSWDPFWQLLVESSARYRDVADPEVVLAERARVVRESIFALPEAEWDVATMFFVAESITAVREEFEHATERFVRSVRPGAPLAAAFMRESEGYWVGDQWFPAVAVTEQDIEDLMRRLGADVTVERIMSAEQLREGYDGMVLITGYRGAPNGHGDRHR